jgi:hypothetical protein
MLKLRYKDKENTPTPQPKANHLKMLKNIGEGGSSKDVESLLFKRVRSWFREKGIERGDP